MPVLKPSGSDFTALVKTAAQYVPAGRGGKVSKSGRGEMLAPPSLGAIARASLVAIRANPGSSVLSIPYIMPPAGGTTIPALILPAYARVTAADWTQTWQPYLQQLATANSSGVTVTVSRITGGATFTGNNWAGGVFAPDGNIYFAPNGAPNILKLTVATGVTSNLTGGATYTTPNGWWGGVLGPDSNVYFAPGSSSNILKLNVATGVTSNITGGGATYTGSWWGGAVGPDGNIYFAPQGAGTILKLNVTTGATSNITGTASLGAVLGPDGNIYFAPDGTNIVKLNVYTGTTTNIPAAYSGFFGGVLGQDGNIYFCPFSPTGGMLKLTVATGETTLITGGGSYSVTGWYGGVLGADGKIYCTPTGNSTSILVLNVATGATSNINTGTGLGSRGGVLAPDGNIYFASGNGIDLVKLTFSGLSQLPSSNYCLSPYNNKL